MLVEIAKFVQLPKGMVLRRVRSFVRLKSVNLFRNVIREEAERLGITFRSVAVTNVLVDREIDVLREVASRVRLRHLPSHLVETGPETVQELSELHSKHRLESLQLKPLDVSSVFRIIPADYGVRFFHVGGHMPVESVKVKLIRRQNDSSK